MDEKKDEKNCGGVECAAQCINYDNITKLSSQARGPYFVAIENVRKKFFRRGEAGQISVSDAPRQTFHPLALSTLTRRSEHPLDCPLVRTTDFTLTTNFFVSSPINRSLLSRSPIA